MPPKAAPKKAASSKVAPKNATCTPPVPSKKPAKPAPTKATDAPRIEAWSFSRWKDYCTCPRKAKYKIIDKLREPGSAAMDRGSMIHKLAEDYCNGVLKKFPPELLKFKDEFLKLKKQKPRCEEQWAFTNLWTPTSWFAKDAWCRVKTDALAITGRVAAIVIDHKTGRPYEEHADQSELYALGAFLMEPDIEEVTVLFWYIDQGPSQNFKKVYTRDQLESLKAKWEQNTKAMLNDTRFAPKPGRHCLRCHFRKDNGGPCNF